MREISIERLNKDVRRILNNPFFVQGLETGITYERTQDDDDGTGEGRIQVCIIPRAGDIVVTTDKHHRAMRFRNSFGGGMSPRVFNALMVLAYAIKLDNEERPQA